MSATGSWNRVLNTLAKRRYLVFSAPRQGNVLRPQRNLVRRLAQLGLRWGAGLLLVAMALALLVTPDLKASAQGPAPNSSRPGPLAPGIVPRSSRRSLIPPRPLPAAVSLGCNPEPPAIPRRLQPRTLSPTIITYLERGRPNQREGLVGLYRPPAPALRFRVVQPVQRPLEGTITKRKRPYRSQHGIHIHRSTVRVPARRPHVTEALPQGVVMV